MSGAIARRTEITLAVDRWGGQPAELFGAGHGLLLALLRKADPATAEAIHDAGRRKALALSPLRIRPLPGGMGKAILGISVWEQELADLVTRGCQSALDMPAKVLGHTACVLHAEEAEHRALTEMLRCAEPAGNIAAQGVCVMFETPALFSFGRGISGKQRYGLLPQPGLVIASWLRAWQQAGGESFGAEAAPDWLEERVALRTVTELSTRTVHTNHTALTGFVGQVSYQWMGLEQWGPALLRALALFSAYCGTGAKTGYGFGVTRPVNRIESYLSAPAAASRCL